MFLLFAPALADEAVDAKVTAAIVETIQMTTKGELDAWIAKYCEPTACGDEARKEQWKAYQLKQANLHASACLVDGAIQVRQRQGDAGSGQEVRWYLTCTGRQMPAAVRFRWDAEAGRVWFGHLGF